MQDVASHFDASNCDDPIAKLSKLEEQGSLLDQLEHFDKLLARVDVMRLKKWVSFFREVYTLPWKSL